MFVCMLVKGRKHGRPLSGLAESAGEWRCPGVITILVFVRFAYLYFRHFWYSF